mmetsp:Transcript_7114/g.18111  ORF Transcript_7114/g.18111 Transcript_7114/m.18111 type:complete len:274 (-) Transcript_7114:151-972(-)
MSHWITFNYGRQWASGTFLVEQYDNMTSLQALGQSSWAVAMLEDCEVPVDAANAPDITTAEMGETPDTYEADHGLDDLYMTHVVSLFSCTCQFPECWHLPCRHMFRLYTQLNIVSIPPEVLAGRWAVLDKQAAIADFYRVKAERARIARRPDTADVDDINLSVKEKRELLVGVFNSITTFSSQLPRREFEKTMAEAQKMLQKLAVSAPRREREDSAAASRTATGDPREHVPNPQSRAGGGNGGRPKERNLFKGGRQAAGAKPRASKKKSAAPV